MAMQRTLMSLAVTAFLIKLAIAANYTVGGSNGGWDQTTDLQTWASSQSFLVGDNLIFQYAPNHDVLEVSKADYDSCQASSPLQSHNDGNTDVALSSPGKRYFICGTAGHCSQGMKVEIDTLATSATPPASLVTPPISSPAPETHAPSPAKSPESTPTPPASLVTSPISSPAPETHAPSPAKSPESTPTMPPSSTRKSHMSIPTSSPPPSSANKDSFRISLTMGFILVMVLLAF